MPLAPSTGAAPALRLGTRRSPLALAQSGAIARELAELHPGLEIELVTLTTTGDVLPGDLSAAGGKGLFTLELERGLLDGALDLAVHSLKDLPVELPPGLEVAAFPPRADPRDVLVSELAADLDGLPPGAVVLTGSLRRRAQILLHRPDLRVEPIRGNVDTRLRKWRETGAAALVLAHAGLERLGLLDDPSLPVHALPPEVLLPAPGQGTLALETMTGSRAAALCRALEHAPTARAAAAERRLVGAFGGDCTLPLAAWARVDTGFAGDRDGENGEGGKSGEHVKRGGAGQRAQSGAGGEHGKRGGRAEHGAGGEILRLTALLATPDGRHVARGEAVGEDPAAVAAACAAALRADGAGEILALIDRQRAEVPPSAAAVSSAPSSRPAKDRGR
jgi:hydroxymethylbilane synthase